MRMDIRIYLDQICLEYSGFTKGHQSRMRDDPHGSVSGVSVLRYHSEVILEASMSYVIEFRVVDRRSLLA